MDLYDILKFVHVLAATVWVGGGILFHILAERAVKSNDTARIGTLLTDAEAIGKGYFGPASGVTLVAGLWLVFEGDWAFDHVFILGGLAGIVLSSIIGFGLIQPAATRVQTALAGSGTITDDIRSSIDRVRNFSRLDLVILVVVVFLMTVKPGS